MLNSAHYHYHLRRLSTNGRVVWAHTLNSVAGSLILIFVPIFLLRSGYAFPEVLTYLMLQGLFSVPIQLSAAWFVTRYGANLGMSVGLLSQVVFLLILLSLLTVHWPLALLAFFWALARATYWVSFHLNFSKSRSHKKGGRQVGLVNIIKIASGGFAPAVGGVAATQFGINWVYGFGAGLFLLAAVIMLRNADLTKHRRLSFQSLSLRKIRPDLLANAGNGVTTVAESIVWPILVSLIVSSYAGIGLLSSVVIFASIGAAFYVGRREAVRGTKHYLRQGSLLAGVTDGLRLLAQNAGHIFGINFFWGVGTALYYTPFMTQYYEHADEEPRIEYITAMETVHEITWGGFFFILLLLSAFLPERTVLLCGIGIAIPGNYIIQRMR